MKSPANPDRFSFRKTIFSIVLLFAFASVVPAQTTSIDVLFVYTSDVKALYGDHDGVLAKAQEIIAKGTLGFENSSIDAAFNLAHLEEIPYAQSGSFSTDLNFIASDADIATLRSDWGADLVCLLRDGSLGGTAGLGRVLKIEGGRDSDAYSVVSVQSSVSGNVFSHEAGHNLGAAHDKFNSDPNDGLHLYSHGHHFNGTDNGTYRTIMAYQENFNSQVNYFSNPNVNFQGTPTGIAEGNAGPADNARTLRATAPLVAAYEEHQPASPAFLASTTSFAFVTGQSRALNAQAVGSPPLSYQWYEGVSGDTSAPIGGATGKTFTTPILTDSQSYWVQATNSNGTTNSPNYNLTVTDLPNLANSIDQSNEPGNDSFSIIGLNFDSFWQEFVPTSSYLHEIELRILKQGNPGQLRIFVSDDNGFIHYDQTHEQSAFTSVVQWFSIPVQFYVQTGETYRVSVQRIDSVDPDNANDLYGWQLNGAASDTYLPAMSGAAVTGAIVNWEDTRDFYFRSIGSNATAPSATIDPSEKSLSATASSYDITITSSGAWTAIEALDWVSLSPTSGTGNGTVTVSINVNNTGSERIGTVLIGGDNHTITQSASTFSGTLSPLQSQYQSSGGSGAITLTTVNSWNASSDSAWITLSGSSSGAGDATINYNVAANASSTLRTGNITIESLTHSIRQQGSVDGQSLSFGQWLLAYYTSSEIAAMSPNSSDIDSDGDGLSNKGEYLLKLDPTSSQSRPTTTMTRSATSMALSISPIPAGVAVSVNSSDDFLEWSAEPERTPTINNNTATFTLPLDPGRFYQISITETP